MVFELLNEQLRKHAFEEPTEVQVKAIPLILRGKSVLIIGPTGSGKTEAAFLPVLSLYLEFREKHGYLPGIHVLYITPLRALNRDMFRRFARICGDVGVKVSIRHGDTPRSVRRMQVKDPPEVLITTPETLQAILPLAGMRRWLREVKWVIVDELHELIESKRGTQLAVGLERLKLLAKNSVQLIGLSATISNPELASEFLAGSSGEVEIVEVKSTKPYSIKVEYPVAGREDFELSLKLMCKPDFAARLRCMINYISSSTSTLIFVNCREFAEFISSRLRLAGIVAPSHHSSLSRVAREIIESEFKDGLIHAIVCTSSLELGIDVGHVDLVIQYLSPRQVVSFIQRVGRSGHFLKRVSRGVIICVNPDDLLESLVISHKALKWELEEPKVHVKALDVLAHQVAGLVLDFGGEIGVSKAFEVVKSSYPYRSLTFSEFIELLNYIDGLNLVKFADEKILETKRTRLYYYRHLTTIPEEVKYPVIDEVSGEEVGYLGEDFFSEYGKPGVKIILKGRPWIVTRISGFNVYVKPASDYTAAIPGWEGEVLPTSYGVAVSVGELRRLIENLWFKGLDVNEIAEHIRSSIDVEVRGLEKAIEYLIEHLRKGYPMPHDKRIVIEAFGDFIVVHSCYGHGVNRCIARILSELIKVNFKVDCIARWDAYRVLFMTKSKIELEKVAELLKSLSDSEAEAIIYGHVDPYILRHVAIKFDALPRGMYYKSASYLLYLPEKFRDTPVYDEAFRYQLTEHYDFGNFKRLLNMIRSGEVEVVCHRSGRPSPIARLIVELGDLALMDDKHVFLERIMNRVLDLLCLDCLYSWRILTRDFDDDIKCPKCSSKAISIVKWKLGDVIEAYRKLKMGLKLTEEEKLLIAYAKMSADLITIYGKRAAIALSVKGVGPLTAYQILAKMHVSIDELVSDLMEAMKEYLETRDYWSNS